MAQKYTKSLVNLGAIREMDSFLEIDKNAK